MLCMIIVLRHDDELFIIINYKSKYNPFSCREIAQQKKMEDKNKLDRVKARIDAIPDFPKPGILFR